MVPIPRPTPRTDGPCPAGEGNCLRIFMLGSARGMRGSPEAPPRLRVLNSAVRCGYHRPRRKPPTPALPRLVSLRTRFQLKGLFRGIHPSRSRQRHESNVPSWTRGDFRGVLANGQHPQRFSATITPPSEEEDLPRSHIERPRQRSSLARERQPESDHLLLLRTSRILPATTG